MDWWFWVLGAIFALTCWIVLTENRHRELNKVFSAILRQQRSNIQRERKELKEKSDSNP